MTRHAMPRADAAWLHMDRPTNRMVINAVLWFDGRRDLIFGSRGSVRAYVLTAG